MIKGALKESERALSIPRGTGIGTFNKSPHPGRKINWDGWVDEGESGGTEGSETWGLKARRGGG